MFNQPQRQATEPPRPLAFHLRARRQWVSEAGLSQEALAALAGVSVRTLRKYEAMRELPEMIDSLLRLAIALRVPFERLIDPHLLESLRQETLESRTAPEKTDHPAP